MRRAGLVGAHRRRQRLPAAARAVAAAFGAFANHRAGDLTADALDRRWVADITQHETSEGSLYLAVER